MEATELTDLAEDIAERAVGIIRRARSGTVRIADTKSTATDLVTETDREVEAFVVAELLRARPDDAVLGEESGEHLGTSGVTWIIDPIDGTTNFYYDLPGFNVSVAAAINGQVVAGVVADPVRDEVFRATSGGGATCNGRTIHGASPTDLSKALIATGFSYAPDRRHAQAQVVVHVINRVRDIRRFGAAALDLCNVGAGRFDGYFESGLSPWDLAAGGLVAAEAGCGVTGAHGEAPDGRLVIAGSSSIMDALVRLLGEAADRGLAVEDPSARAGWEFGRLVL